MSDSATQQQNKVETYGVEPIPDKDRYATPYDFYKVIFGGCNTFSTSVLGSFPIVFGLSFEAGLVAIILGVLVGSLILSPMGLFGALNGTNNAVSSGGHFGIHGRLVGSFLSLLTAVAFFSLSVWSSGDALVGGIQRLSGIGGGSTSQAIAYGLFAILVLVICIYGFRLLLWVNRVTVVASTILFIVGIPAFFSYFTPNYPGDVHFGQPGFWAAFVGAALVALSNPISFGAFLGDWARYIPSNTPRIRILMAVVCSQIASLLPFIFGLATASIIAVKAHSFISNNDYVGGLLAVSPQWFFVPVCVIAFLGGLTTGGGALYGTGLDLSSLVPNVLSRLKATVVVGVIAFIFIFAGHFYFNLVQSVSTFATLIVTCTTPWIVIMTIGLIKRRGWYDNHDLQAFSRREQGGRYWFFHGWNLRGMVSWIVSAAVGLMFVNLPGQFVGKFGNLLHGIDISLPVTILLAAFLYSVLLLLFPESKAVYKDA